MAIEAKFCEKSESTAGKEEERRFCGGCGREAALYEFVLEGPLPIEMVGSSFRADEVVAVCRDCDSDLFDAVDRFNGLLTQAALARAKR